MKKLTEMTRIYTRNNIELWGAFYEYTNVFNETEIYVSDIHIIDTKNQKVVYQTFDRISYNNHDKINLVNIAENLIDAVMYLYNKKEMGFKLQKTLNDLFQKGCMLSVQAYARRQKKEDQRKTNMIKYITQKEKEKEIEQAIINHAKKNRYLLFIYHNRYLTVEDTKEKISYVGNIEKDTQWVEINHIIKNNARYKVIFDQLV